MKLEVLKAGDYKASFLRMGDYTVLFSYGKAIVAIDAYNTKYYRLCEFSDLTTTTSKHLKQFLEMFGFEYNRKEFLESPKNSSSVLLGFQGGLNEI